jgi:methyl-accepting chemotaxis protein
MAKKKNSLRRKMIFYFLLIALANIFVATEVIIELNSQSYQKIVLKSVADIINHKQPPEHILSVQNKIGKKYVIMMMILIIVSAVVLLLFVRQVASPLQYVIDKSQKISAGDLSVTIRVHTQDEIAELANLINDLTINIQEILAQVERVQVDLDMAVIFILEKLKKMSNVDDALLEKVEKMVNIIEDVKLIGKSFTFYTPQNLLKEINENKE